MLWNGVPQGSILVPVLFNIYNTSDRPVLTSSRYIYADDTAIGYTDKAFQPVERTLKRDTDLLQKMRELTISQVLKTEVWCHSNLT